MKRTILWSAVLGGAVCAWVGGARVRAAEGAAAPAQPQGSVRRIELPDLGNGWPEAPGRDVVEVQCGVCHTGRYVTMQPAFPRKTWEAQVEKMRKVYGAPIADQSVPTIVEYLMKVRGKE
ncbi:MAG TPA: hypothetical protein VEA69_26065 [Tepidisphaeraceae bacterium]|nr:hypothetical protein [Tepidisphaeraceae bacterium]